MRKISQPEWVITRDLLRAGFTQKKVAKMGNISQATVSRIANSKSYADYRGLIKITDEVYMYKKPRKAPKFKPFNYKAPVKKELKPYFCRGHLVGHFTKEVIEDLESDYVETFSEVKTLKDRVHIMEWFVWACVIMVGTVLILSLWAK